MGSEMCIRDREVVFPRRMAVTMKVARVLPERVWATITARIARSS